MNYIKPYLNWVYKEGVTDCWTLVQHFYLNNYQVTLPDFPFCATAEEFSGSLATCGLVVEISGPERHCIVHKSGILEHVGINLDNKYYMHMTHNGVQSNKIGNSKCRFYRVYAKA